MSLLEAKKALSDAAEGDTSTHPSVLNAIDDLLEELDDFFTMVEDYDEWELMYPNLSAEEDQPGFSLAKLRKMLGFNEDGTE